MKITKPIGLVNAFRVSQREYHHFQPHREKESWNVLSFRKGKKKKRKKKKKVSSKNGIFCSVHTLRSLASRYEITFNVTRK